MVSKPLEGTKVIDMTNYGAAPTTARILADWGADVIKVETLSGEISRHNDGDMGVDLVDGINAYIEMQNAGKKSICLDTKTPEGLEILMKLIAGADVFLSNTRLKSLRKLGLDYESLSVKFPRLVWAHLSGYGEVGPAANEPGFDAVSYWAQTGCLADFIEKDTAPLVPPLGFGDYNTGSVLAGGIAAALYKQQKTGTGERVTASLMGTAIWNLGLMFVATQGSVTQYPKTRKITSPLVNTYQCKDGEWILFCMFEYERFFPTVCDVLGLDTFIGDGRFATMGQGLSNCDILIPAIDEKFRQRTADEWEILFKQNDLPYSKLNHIKDLVHNEQALANNFIYKCTTRTTGDWYLCAPPIQFGGQDKPDHKNAPYAGEHTEETLRHAGYTDEQIKNLEEKGVVRQKQ